MRGGKIKQQNIVEQRRISNICEYVFKGQDMEGGSVRYFYVSIDLKMRYTSLHTLLG
jgi:hypothetical protein